LAAVGDLSQCRKAAREGFEFGYTLSSAAVPTCAAPEMPRPLAESREAYPYFLAIQTRWSDNDVYGHVNNTVYYSYFDTVVNRYLIEQGVLDPTGGEVIGLVVATHCDFFSEIAFPDQLSAGLRIAHLGNSSVRYEIGLFRDAESRASAQGHLVHVYVQRLSRRPTPLPTPLRDALVPLMSAPNTD